MLLDHLTSHALIAFDCLTAHRDHASLPDGARRGPVTAAAVLATLAREYGAGGGQCAASHAIVLHCGKC